MVSAEHPFGYAGPVRAYPQRARGKKKQKKRRRQ